MPSITVEQINTAMPPVPTVGTPPAGVPRRDLTNQALQALRADVAELEAGKADAEDVAAAQAAAEAAATAAGNAIDRANHEGTQAIATVEGLQAELDAKLAASAAVTLGAPVASVLPTDEVVVTRGGAPAPASVINLLSTKRFKRVVFDVDGTDGTAALLAAVAATADFAGDTTIAVSGHGIIITSNIVWPAGKMAILIGDGERVTTFDWRGTGPMLRPSGNYNFQKFQISGASGPAGKTGIGNGGVDGASGAAVLRDLRFDQIEYGVDFNAGWEHPIGVDTQNIYCQGFLMAGLNFGSSEAAGSGESCWDFSTVMCNQTFGSAPVSATTVTVNTPTATADRVAWVAAIPRYGFLLLRSANGTTNWQIVPNQRLPITSGTSFDAEKVGGETWVYRLQAISVGVAIYRAKSVNIDTLQAEYSALGLYVQDVANVSIGSLYSETRSASTPRNGLAQLMAVRSNVHCQTTWCEEYAYQAINVDSSIDVEMLRSSNNIRALALHGTNLTTGQCRTEYGFIRHGGPVVPTYAYNGSSIIERGTSNYSQIGAISRPRFPARNGGAVRSVGIANNTLANVLTFDVPSNTSTALVFAFDARTAPSSVSRIAATGILTIAAVSASGTVVAAAAVSGAANAVQAGTLTAAPVFSTTVSGSTVTVRFIADSTHLANWNVTLAPIAQTGSADNISVLTV